MVAFLNDVKASMRAFKTAGDEYHLIRVENGFDVTEPISGETLIEFRKNNFGFNVHTDTGRVGRVHDEGCYVYYRHPNQDRYVNSDSLADTLIQVAGIEILKMKEKQ